MCRKVRGRHYFPQKVHLALRGLTLVTGCQRSRGTVTARVPQADCHSFPCCALPCLYLDSAPPGRKMAIPILPLSPGCDRNLSLFLTLTAVKQTFLVCILLI